MKYTKPLLFFLFFLPSFALSAGFVPCGGENEPQCQLCHVFLMFRNIYDFFLLKIAAPLAILMVIISGFLYAFSYSNFAPPIFKNWQGPALLNLAKKTLFLTLIGFALIISSWLLINTFFQVIGVSNWQGITQGWWQVAQNCPTQPSGSSCQKQTCQSLNKECGVWYDNCGDFLNCGTCSSDYVCDNSGKCVAIKHSSSGSLPKIDQNYTNEVNKAIKVNGPFQNYGYWYVFDVSIPRNSITYFLIDPKGFVIPYSNLLTSINIRIEDMTFGEKALFDFRVLELDENNNLIKTWPVSLGTGGMYTCYVKEFTQDKYNKGEKILIEVIEKNYGSTVMNIKWN